MRRFFLVVGVVGSGVLVTMYLAALFIQHAGRVRFF